MLKLKDFALPGPVLQSPMAGCTDLAFRLVAREKGMGLAFLEMISSDALVRKNAKTLALMARPPEDRPLGAQIVGSDPGTMAEAARLVEEMGFDILDINCGCPVPKVTSPGGGSALLLEPEKSKKIFSAVVSCVKKIPVTVKMRKGYADPSGDEAVRLARLAEEAGCQAVTVHGRTRAQGYSGRADWTAIRNVKAAVKIPVFGNGDIFSGEAARRMFEETGCDGIVIGRGALGNPWIFREIGCALEGRPLPPRPDLREIQETALRHLELEIQTDGPRNGALKFRKIAAWYFKDMPGCAKLRAQLNVLKGAEEMRAAIFRFSGSLP